MWVGMCGWVCCPGAGGCGHDVMLAHAQGHHTAAAVALPPPLDRPANRPTKPTKATNQPTQAHLGVCCSELRQPCGQVALPQQRVQRLCTAGNAREALLPGRRRGRRGGGGVGGRTAGDCHTACGACMHVLACRMCACLREHVSMCASAYLCACARICVLVRQVLEGEGRRGEGMRGEGGEKGEAATRKRPAPKNTHTRKTALPGAPRPWPGRGAVSRAGCTPRPG